MAHDVFVSHSAKDKATADAVCAVLESRGIRCWVAPRDILPGQDWGGSIIKAINGARAMVLVFSANANASRQIKLEVERAVNKGIPVIPLRIEDVAPTETLEYFISTPHWLDAFTPPLERHLEYLAEVARQIVGGPEADSAAVAKREAREKAETEPARAAEEKRKAVGTAEATRLAQDRRIVEDEARVAEEKRKTAKDVDYDQLLQIKQTSEGRKAAKAGPHRLRQALRKILGSFLSTCIGWLAVILFVAAIYKLTSGGMLFCGAVALGFWLLILVPLYVFVPRTSKLWRTPICTVIGAVIGALLLLGFSIAIGDNRESAILCSIGAVFGGVACCFAAGTAGYFHPA